MKRKRLHKILMILLVFCAVQIAYAGSNQNADGNDGTFGQGNQDNLWNHLQGIRVSIYDIMGNKIGETIDYSNYKPKLDRFYIPKTKVEYLQGASLALEIGNYISKTPIEPLPLIINTNNNGGNSVERIKQIKNYFRDYKVVKNIFDDADASHLYDWNNYEPDTPEKIKKFHASLKEYKILIEPVAYFKLRGYMWAMSATEAALYPNQSELFAYMRSLARKNLPLSLYLEEDDSYLSLLKKPPHGTNSTFQDPEYMRKYLGMAIISFDDAPKLPPQEIQVNYTYHTDTWVISSFLFKSQGEIYGGDEPTASVSVDFPWSLDEFDTTISDIICPKNSSQLVWFRWKTPSTPQKVVISVEGSGEFKGNLTVDVIEDKEKTPPDPKPHDRYSGFSSDFNHADTSHLISDKTTSSWSVYYNEWYQPMMDDPDGNIDPETGKIAKIPSGEGRWLFKQHHYRVKLEAEGEILPSSLTPTASGKNMKSGYGLNSNVKVNLINQSPYDEDDDNYTNGVWECITPQKVKAWFPEFLYQTYNRILELDPQDSDSFVFKKNKYSQEFHIPDNEKSRIHFTPIWYPDREYNVKFEVYDAFTPADHLSMQVEDKLFIHGNMYQDWHMGPTNEKRN